MAHSRSKTKSRSFKLTASRKRKAIKRAAFTINIAVVGVIAFFVFNNTSSATPTLASAQSVASASDINPLDQASSADIALTVAQASDLPEYTAVANQAQSAAANEAMASDSDNIVDKPEVVTTALKSRADISDYTAVADDTVASLAQKFGVTSSSIMWSNGLTGNTVTAGQHLVIPPVNGIVYIVKAGDTAASLAQKYGASQQEIIAYNDAEIDGLKTGEQIIIPNGQIKTASAPVASVASVGSGLSASWGGPTYGYNGYDFGYCTWYVATQLAVPSNWGNASSWAYYAGLSGWNVSTTPAVGAIAQTALAAGGEGHVAVVEAVNGDQVEIRDMNNYGDGGGWDRVGSGWVSVSTFQHYITP